MPNQRASVPYLPTAGRMVEWIPEESTNGAGFERSSKHVVGSGPGRCAVPSDVAIVVSGTERLTSSPYSVASRLRV